MKQAAAPKALPATDDRTAAIRRIAPLALTALAIAFVAARFAMGAHDTLARTRDGACLALEPAPLPAILRDKPTPDFQLPDANGKTVTLKQQLGHPVLLNFWATWCAPCVDEVPSLEDLARRIEGTDLRMLAVSVDDDWAAIRRFFAKGSRIGVVLDKSHDVPKLFGTDKYPETFLIDAQGKIRYYYVNKRDWSRPEAIACLESLR